MHVFAKDFITNFLRITCYRKHQPPVDITYIQNHFEHQMKHVLYKKYKIVLFQAGIAFTNKFTFSRINDYKMLK